MKKIIVLGAFVCFLVDVCAQSDRINLPGRNYRALVAKSTIKGIATGIHLNDYPTIELGYCKYLIFDTPMSFGKSYSVESYFLDKVILAPKANYWFNLYFINAGLNMVWYFDVEGTNSLKFRPELGLGYRSFKINYARNISITNEEMRYVGKHFISVNYYIKLKKK